MRPSPSICPSSVRLDQPNSGAAWYRPTDLKDLGRTRLVATSRLLRLLLHLIHRILNVSLPRDLDQE